MHEVIMPKLGLDMTTGTIEKWHKKPGDQVEAGEILLEVMTDKVSLEVEAYNAGTLLKIVRQEGEEVPVTEVIAYIGAPGEEIQEEKRPAALNNESETDRNTVKISPIARRIAREKGVDYSRIQGTGPDGRIIKEDIEEELAKSIVPKSGKKPRERTRKPLTGVRKVIAERLSYSARNIPHAMVTIVVDAEPIINLKAGLKSETGQHGGIAVSVTDIIIKASAMVLAEQPEINAALIEGDHVIYDDINIGIAVAAEEGLVVPTVYRANTLSLKKIAERRKDLVTKAGTSGLAADEVTNGTFTISNLGMYGIRSFTAIINPPQGAILMVGEIYKTPAVVDERIEIGTFMQIGLTFDHRILDGADAARFLGRLKEVLQSTGEMVKD